jgi:uncharacterized membrane protein (DUF4010 family)
MVIAIASTILFFRILIEIATVAPSLLREAGPPLLILAFLLGSAAFVLWRGSKTEENNLPAQENPSELRTAIVFGLIYALVLFACCGSKDAFGGRGLFVVAILSGLTDVDAITLSVSQLVKTERLTGGEGWRLIVAAALSNLVFKGAIVGFLGDRVYCEN